MEGHGHENHASETHRLKPVNKPGLSGIPWALVILWGLMFIPLIIIDSILGTGLWTLWAVFGFIVWIGAKIPDMWGLNRWVIRICLGLLLVLILAQAINFALILALVAIVVLGVMWTVTVTKNEAKLDEEAEEAAEGDGTMDALIDPSPPVDQEKLAEQRAAAGLDSEGEVIEEVPEEAAGAPAVAVAAPPLPASPPPPGRPLTDRTGKVWIVREKSS